MKKRTSSVCIFTGTNLVAYNLASILYRKNISFLFCPSQKRFSFTRLSNKFAAPPFVKDPIDSEEYLAKTLSYFEAAVADGHKMLPLFTNDDALNFFIKNKKKLEKYIVLPPFNLEQVIDKKTFFQLIGNELLDFMPATDNVEVLKFPIVAKPIKKDFEKSFHKKYSKKILLLRNKKDVEKLNQNERENLLFQEFVPHENGNEFSFCGYRSSSGKIHGYSLRHVEHYPKNGGRIAETQIVADPDVIRLGVRSLEALAYVGIADIQMIRATDGKLKIIEMNPRFWCGHEILPMNSEDIALGYLKDEYGLGVSPSLAGKDPKMRWRSVLKSAAHFPKIYRATELWDSKNEAIQFKLVKALFFSAKYLYYLLSNSWRRTFSV